jgi:hypothetical protein
MITRIHRNTPDRPYTNNHCSNAVYTLPRHPEMPTTWHVKVADIRLSRNSRGSPQGVVRSGVTEELVAMQVEREPLKEPSDVEDAAAPSLEDLRAGVEPLDKSARLAILVILAQPPKTLNEMGWGASRTGIPQTHRRACQGKVCFN